MLLAAPIHDTIKLMFAFFMCHTPDGLEYKGLLHELWQEEVLQVCRISFGIQTHIMSVLHHGTHILLRCIVLTSLHIFPDW
jgi:hypothetical protein